MKFYCILTRKMAPPIFRDLSIFGMKTDKCGASFGSRNSQNVFTLAELEHGFLQKPQGISWGVLPDVLVRFFVGNVPRDQSQFAFANFLHKIEFILAGKLAIPFIWARKLAIFELNLLL
jgi:hypothetical protein